MNKKPTVNVPLWELTDRTEQIKDILQRGKYVKFTNGPIIKVVTEANYDELGDLLGCFSTGKTLYVCSNHQDYCVEEIEPEELEELRKQYPNAL